MINHYFIKLFQESFNMCLDIGIERIRHDKIVRKCKNKSFLGYSMTKQTIERYYAPRISE